MSVTYTRTVAVGTRAQRGAIWETVDEVVEHGIAFGCIFEAISYDRATHQLTLQLSAALPEAQRTHLSLPVPVVVP